MRTGTEKHEQKLAEVIRQLEAEGYRVVDLKGFSPDAVATKDGKLIAIEVLQVNYRKQEGIKPYLRSRWSVKGKKRQYSMFDDLKLYTYVRQEEPQPAKKQTLKIRLMNGTGSLCSRCCYGTGRNNSCQRPNRKEYNPPLKLHRCKYFKPKTHTPSLLLEPSKKGY